MQKLILILTCFVTMLAATSCSQTYTCRCDGGALGNGINIDIDNKTKKEAEKQCDAHESNAPFGMHNCRLK
ncbi:MAG: hypothetical protein EOP51_06405 [Sphingobacteriales bacterium]|nr:MAG: hypothetical protein EOP51_06405 [Sphingobacteriales bacterium]